MLEEFDPLLTIDELCVILAIGKNTAYSLLNSGDISAFRIGRIWKIPKTTVIEYIATCGGKVR